MHFDFLRTCSGKVFGDGSRWGMIPLAILVCASIMVVGGSCEDENDNSPLLPATDPPATDPPATDPPATDPPATDPPATDPPATDPPATDPPALTRYMDELVVKSEAKTVKGLSDRWGSVTWDDGSEKGLRGPKCMFDGDYETYYRSSLDGVSDDDRVVLYLGPGGACFDALTCLVPYQMTGGKFALVRLEAFAPLGQEEKAILSSTEGISPLHDLPVVFAPYCDGSVFSGDNDVEYKSPLSEPAPSTKTAYHRGLQNLSAAISTIQKKFSKAPKEIVILGSSAGGMGILTALGLVHDVFPETGIFVFSDSAAPIFSPDAKAAIAGMFENWKLEEQFPAGCDDCKGPSFYPIITNRLKAVPQIKRIGFAGFSKDPILSAYAFFSLFGLEILAGQIKEKTLPGVTFDILKALIETYMPDGEPGLDAFTKMFLDDSKKIADAFPDRVKRFMELGDSNHMMLWNEAPVSLLNPAISGKAGASPMKAYDWLNQLINSDKAWSNEIGPQAKK